MRERVYSEETAPVLNRVRTWEGCEISNPRLERVCCRDNGCLIALDVREVLAALGRLLQFDVRNKSEGIMR